MTTPRPTTVESLARSWDDVVLGNPSEPGKAPIDESDVLRLLHQPDHHLDADPHFVANLQHELVTAWKRDPDHRRQEAAPVVLARLAEAESAPTTRSRRWSRLRFPQSGVLASAALLLLTLISAIAMIASVWQKSLDRESATESIFAPIVHDPATAIGVLASFRVPQLPPALGRVLMERWTYPPHAEPVATERMTGPLLIYVIKGEVDVALTGGESLLLEENGSPLNPLMSLNASTGRLSAGQALLLPAQTQMTTSNRGDDEAIVIATAAYADTITDWMLPFGQTIIKQDVLGSTLAAFPTGQVEFALQRSVIAAGESLAAPPEGVVQLVGTESQYLAYLRRATDGTVTNLESEPLSVLIATITPVG